MNPRAWLEQEKSFKEKKVHSPDFIKPHKGIHDDVQRYDPLLQLWKRRVQLEVSTLNLKPAPCCELTRAIVKVVQARK